MQRTSAVNVRDHEFEEMSDAGGPSPSHLALDDLRDIPLRVSVELGATNMSVGKLLGLKNGAIVQLETLVGELADVQVNDVLIGKGEIVVEGDLLNVRIADVLGIPKDFGETDSGLR